MVMEYFKSQLKTDSKSSTKVGAPSSLVMTSREFSWKEAQLFFSLTEQHGHSWANKAALMQYISEK